MGGKNPFWHLVDEIDLLKEKNIKSWADLKSITLKQSDTRRQGLPYHSETVMTTIIFNLITLSKNLIEDANKEVKDFLKEYEEKSSFFVKANLDAGFYMFDDCIMAFMHSNFTVQYKRTTDKSVENLIEKALFVIVSAFMLFETVKIITINALLENVSKFSDLLYTELNEDNGTTGEFAFKILDRSGKIAEISDFLYNSATSPYSELKRFAEAKATDTEEKIKSEFSCGKYKQNINRILTAEEKSIVPEIEPWYVLPSEVEQACELIQKTSKMVIPFKNFLFRGPAGTGKTHAARAIAYGLGLPYVYITCSANTEIFDFFGQPIPDKNGKIKYVDTSFIEAIKNGWVVEIQEPTVISKEGVLVGLNGILEGKSSITLPTGEVIERHPDAVVICTTNVDYYGCNYINQSVISRMQGVYDLDEPDIGTVIERIIAITDVDDKETVKRVVMLQKQIKNKMLADDIDDGVCGMREIIDCFTVYSVTKNLSEAIKLTIIPKVSTDKEFQNDVQTLVLGAFAS